MSDYSKSPIAILLLFVNSDVTLVGVVVVVVVGGGGGGGDDDGDGVRTKISQISSIARFARKHRES